MNRIVAVLGIALSLVQATAGRGGDAIVDADKPCVVISGADSHIGQRRYRRITSPQEWTRTWQEHKGAGTAERYDEFYDELTLPVIDFEKYMVIAIFQGTRQNGAGLEAISIRHEDSRVVIQFKEKSYETLDGADKVTVYGFLVVPRFTKPISLEESVRRAKGRPSVLEKRAVFPTLFQASDKGTSLIRSEKQTEKPSPRED